jgi:predicted membrane protein
MVDYEDDGYGAIMGWLIALAILGGIIAVSMIGPPPFLLPTAIKGAALAAFYGYVQSYWHRP